VSERDNKHKQNRTGAAKILIPDFILFIAFLGNRLAENRRLSEMAQAL
jgi:hypothetical protein